MNVDPGRLATRNAKLADVANGAERQSGTLRLQLGGWRWSGHCQLTTLDRRDPEFMESTRMVRDVTSCNPDKTMVAETVFQGPCTSDKPELCVM